MFKKAEEVSHSRILDIVSICLAFVVWAVLPSDLSAFVSQMIAEKLLKVIKKSTILCNSFNGDRLLIS